MASRRSADEEIFGGEEVPRELERPRGLDDWMARMESKIDQLAKDMAEVKAMHAQVEEHHETLYGNGKPGMVLDVDRIKQQRKLLAWIIAAVLIPGIAAAAEFIHSVVSSK